MTGAPLWALPPRTFSATTAWLCSRPEFFRRVFRFTSREFAGIPSHRCFHFAFRKMKQTAVLSQFLHSLDVNPCTPARYKQYAEKILMAVHKVPQYWQVYSGRHGTRFSHLSRRRTLWVSPEAALKILTPYGDLVKNFKFLKEVKILSKFFRINLDA